MNINKLNNWFTLTANVGVLIGIIFLIIELQQSNRIATSSAEGEIRSRFIEIGSLAVENPEVASLLDKLSSNTSELSGIEQMQALWYALSFWTFFVSVEEAFNNNTLSDETFIVFQGVLSDLSNNIPGLLPFLKSGAALRSDPSSDSVMARRLRTVLQENNI